MARGTIITTTTKDGTKRYRTIIRINGKQQRRTWDRKKDAENHLDNLSPEVRDATYRDLKKATFREYVEIWKDINPNETTIKPSTLNSYASILESRLLPEFRSFPMTAISHDEISLLRTRLLKGSEDRRALKPNTVKDICGAADIGSKHFGAPSPAPPGHSEPQHNSLCYEQRIREWPGSNLTRRNFMEPRLPPANQY